MIDSIVSGVSGYNPNAYAKAAGARAKEEIGVDSAPESEIRAEDYWTSERMQGAVPPDMGREVPGPKEEPHIPEQSELPQETTVGLVSGSVPQFDGYWTPERMQEAIPPEMGIELAEFEEAPHMIGQA